MKRSRAVPVVLGFLLLAGCGGEDAPPPPATKALPGTPPRVEAALLTTTELGDEWVDLGATPPEDRGYEQCPPGDVLTVDEDPARVGEVQSAFSKGGPPSPVVFFESISMWDTPEVASDRLATFSSMESECESFTWRLGDGEEASVSTTGRPAPALGEEAIATRWEVDFPDGSDAMVDFVAVRIGNAVVLTSVQTQEGDDGQVELGPATFEDLTRRAVDKAQEALPPPG